MSFVRIESDRYHLVEGLLKGSESVFTPCPLSILEGTIDGIVFVDNQDQPKCAAVLSTDFIGGRLIGDALNGEFNEGFIAMMKEHILSKNGSSNFRLFWSAASETWDELIFRIFGYNVFRISRTQFQFDKDIFEALAPVETHPNVHRIDAATINSHESLRREIEGLWGSAENYLQHGVGWVAISSEGRVMGRCNAAFVGGGSAELAIQVNKGVRGQGIGFQLARNFIRDCLDRGVTPNWTCDTQNVPSFKMAQKLGFQADANYNLFASVYTPMFHESSR
jgi:RimJ/RimL family protein N-acetyltransferase